MIHTVWPLQFDFLAHGPIVVEPAKSQLSGDAGLLVIRQFEEEIGLTAGMATALIERRNPDFVQHTLLEMFRCRVYGIIAGYEDQNDYDVLRNDPIFKLIVGRRPDADPLASQPTLSRFENRVRVKELFRLRDALHTTFLNSFTTPPSRLTFDLDAVDDPAHGQQQLTLFHGYYDQNQYLPLLISHAESGQFVTLSLRPGNVHAALGADDDLRLLVTRVRERWPDVEIVVRGDCGFGCPSMYQVCEELGLTYTFGIGGNKKLRALTAKLLAEAEQGYAATGEPQRRFLAFAYQAKSWERERWIVAKAECHKAGTNQRFVVTNRPGAGLLPAGTYDEYVLRGEAENRNKEIKDGLAMDRMSDHRFMANFFRLYLHTTAHNLLVRLRQRARQPAPAVAVALGPDEPPATLPAELPAAALTGKQRQRYFRVRRGLDRFGYAQPSTWRMQLIKVAAEITSSARRIVVRLAANWPYLSLYQQLSQTVLNLAPSG